MAFVVTIVFALVVSVVVVSVVVIISIITIITLIFSNFSEVDKMIIEVFLSYVLVILSCLSLLTHSLAWPGEAGDEAGEGRQDSPHKVSKLATIGGLSSYLETFVKALTAWSNVDP